ncbi:hypothetical protein RLC09_00255 [Streptococcus pneumoniae]|nr:hypothetical protein [Streptococcus pneumoniae]
MGEKRNHPGSKLRQGFWMVFRLGVNNWGFIFDFGDEWRFECQVLREIETEDQEAYLVRSVGTSPEQYPDYDGFDYEEW